MRSRVIRFSIYVSLLATHASGQARQIVAISHRGEHLHHPENTIPAFQAAIQAGADFIEVDVRTTSDGRLVLSHDDTVNRCTNGQGKVSEMTYAQIQRLDAGIKMGPEWTGIKMPSFDQTLDLARVSKIGIYVDVKSASAADLVSHIESHSMSDRVVIYCGLKLAKELLALHPQLKVMPESRTTENARTLIDQLHPKVLAFDARDFTLEIIAIAKQAGVQIYVDRLGPADNPEAWQAAIDAGADGIQTDKPRELVQFLKAKGYR